MAFSPLDAPEYVQLISAAAAEVRDVFKDDAAHANKKREVIQAVLAVHEVVAKASPEAAKIPDQALRLIVGGVFDLIVGGKLLAEVFD